MTSALPAAAQWYGRPEYGAPVEPYGYDHPAPVFRGDSRPLPPFSIVERLEEQGYEDITRPRYNGSVYELDATSPRGRRVRLVIDAFRGNVVQRLALGSGDEGEPRGWFGNNVRPPDMGAPRRYTARPSEDDDDGPDTFERLARPPGASPVPAPRRVETEPLPAAPNRTARVPAEAKPRETPVARVPAPDREASRSDLSLPKPDGDGPAKVEGVNPAAKPSARGAAPSERASKPETNRAFETARTDPSATPKPVAPAKPAAPTATAPAAKAPAAAGMPTVPAPIVSQAEPAEKPAVTADTSRPNKPVRVIEGVTPVYPEANGAKPQ